MTRTLTGLYDTQADALAAVRDLEATGISHDQISLVANNEGDHHTANQKEGNEAGKGAGGGAVGGAVVAGGAGLLAGLGLIAIPGIGPVVATGWLVATAVGAVGGAAVGAAGGGIIGSMIGNGVPEDDAHVYAEGVRRGGSLVTVKVEDEMAPKAEAILREYRQVDMTARGAAYREQGWERFDEQAPPYTAAETEAQQHVSGRNPTP
jgi:hypothetical protein